jgi:CBS domain-containing protein
VSPEVPAVTCANFMTPDPVTVGEREPIGRAAEVLLGSKLINLPVIGEDGRLVGLFGIYDLLALLVPRIAVVGDLLPNLRFVGDDIRELRLKYADVRKNPVHRAMNREPVTVYTDTPIIEAVRLFCRNHMTIPVLDRETRRLAGMISYWDAARAVMDPEQ